VPTPQLRTSPPKALPLWELETSNFRSKCPDQTRRAIGLHTLRPNTPNYNHHQPSLAKDHDLHPLPLTARPRPHRQNHHNHNRPPNPHHNPLPSINSHHNLDRHDLRSAQQLRRPSRDFQTRCRAAFQLASHARSKTHRNRKSRYAESPELSAGRYGPEGFELL
jgi:hypothetical protein